MMPFISLRFQKAFLCLLSLVFIFLSQNLYGIKTITEEYPELIEFFNSSEFKEQIRDCKIETTHQDPEKSNYIACMAICADSSGISKKLLFDSLYINKKLITAEEFKYMICHELGHLHDKKFIIKNILPLIVFSLSTIKLGTSALKQLFQRNGISFAKKMALMISILSAEYLLFMKLARDGEFFADEYAIKLTKNKDAAVSILSKRKLLQPSVQSKFKFLNQLRNLFENHPNEDLRIENINKIQI